MDCPMCKIEMDFYCERKEAKLYRCLNKLCRLKLIDIFLDGIVVTQYGYKLNSLSKDKKCPECRAELIKYNLPLMEITEYRCSNFDCYVHTILISL